MALTSRKRYPNRVSRRRIPGVGAETDRPRRQEILVAQVNASSTAHVDILFDQPCSLTGVPDYGLYTGTGFLAITSATLDGTRTSLRLDHTVGVITEVRIPFEDPAVRNMAGGYVRPGVYPPDLP